MKVLLTGQAGWPPRPASMRSTTRASTATSRKPLGGRGPEPHGRGPPHPVRPPARPARLQLGWAARPTSCALHGRARSLGLHRGARRAGPGRGRRRPRRLGARRRRRRAVREARCRVGPQRRARCRSPRRQVERCSRRRTSAGHVVPETLPEGLRAVAGPRPGAAGPHRLVWTLRRPARTRWTTHAAGQRAGATLRARASSRSTCKGGASTVGRMISTIVHDFRNPA